jgi:hypothetical protein
MNVPSGDVPQFRVMLLYLLFFILCSNRSRVKELTSRLAYNCGSCSGSITLTCFRVVGDETVQPH